MGRDRGGKERGSVAITVTLTMTVLLGFAALVVDVGLSWAARASAQTAADSAALAGAAELLAGGPAAAVGAVRDYLNDNVNGLADSPVDPDWPFNTDESDGEIVCWTLPDDPPAAGANCPDGSNALQVLTPPIEVNYAFAPVLGASSNSIKAMAAAAAGPAAPNNCVLCLLAPNSANALRVLGVGGVDVNGGGIAVNSDNPLALVLAGTGDISADQIRVIGGLSDPAGGGQLFPQAELGGPPVPDPLADLPTPDQLASPPSGGNPVQNITSDTTLSPGVYPSITVSNGATLTLEEGVYVVTQQQGFTVTDNATVVSSGDGVTIYLACSGYPTPCSGSGARFRLATGGQFLADPPTTGEYAGLSIFADRGNARRMRLLSSADLTLTGALYGASTRLEVTASDLRVDSLLVVGTLLVNTLGSVEVNYDPSVLLPGVGVPVLIR
jgi:Putative Flp pilus-assembly TadE/G-like